MELYLVVGLLTRHSKLFLLALLPGKTRSQGICLQHCESPVGSMSELASVSGCLKYTIYWKRAVIHRGKLRWSSCQWLHLWDIDGVCDLFWLWAINPKIEWVKFDSHIYSHKHLIIFHNFMCVLITYIIILTPWSRQIIRLLASISVKNLRAELRCIRSHWPRQALDLTMPSFNIHWHGLQEASMG